MMTETDQRESVTIQPIGVIHSPHVNTSETPIQPVYATGIRGRAEIFTQFADGLKDLEGFSHVWLIYHFHQAKAVKLIVKPFVDDTPRGVFATRAPCRPSHIGMSLVKLIRRDGNILHLEDVDILDGTPLLDIKPYIARFDYRENVRSGWQENVDEKTAQTRGRRGYDSSP